MGYVDPDLDRALDMYSFMAAGGDGERIVYAVIEGAPWSKSRPRFAGKRAYQSTDDRDAEERTAWHLSIAAGGKKFTGNACIACIFYRPNFQRVDVDNLLKHVNDAANGVLWDDDSQVTEMMGRLEYDPVNPRTVIIAGRHSSSLVRGTSSVRACTVCGAEIVAKPGDKRKTCSSDCRERSKGHEPLNVPVACQQCGRPFVRTTSAQKMCGPECRQERLRGAHKARALPKSTCADCGALLDHRRGGRCRSCWKAHIRKASA